MVRDIKRRNARHRLLTYLGRGGLLIQEELPSGEVVWCRASRSGEAYSDLIVSRLRAGYRVKGTPYRLGNSALVPHMLMQREMEPEG